MLRKLLLMLLLSASLLTMLNGAEKYAVLITGDYAEMVQDTIPPDKSNPMKEFWYDTFLMWEMLVIEMGYDYKNVYVLFADGEDFWEVDEGTNLRYRPQYYQGLSGLDFITGAYQITDNDIIDGAANMGNLDLVTTELKNKMTETIIYMHQVNLLKPHDLIYLNIAELMNNGHYLKRFMMWEKHRWVTQLQYPIQIQ